VSVMMARFQWDRDNRSLVLLLLLYVAINFPKWQQPVDDGWRALLAVPRLYFVLLLCVLSCAALMPRRDRLMGTRHDWLWVGGLALAFSVEVAVTLHHQRSLDRGFDVRITTSPDVLMVTDPVARQGEVDFIAMRTSGYVMGMIDGNGLRLNSADVDQLAQASATDAHLIEEDGVQPHIVSTSGIGSPSRLEVADAEFPVVSPDGRQLAYLRSRKGRNQMWLRTLRGPNAADAPITPSGVDVEEMTFLPDGSIVFSAFNNDRPPTLYLYRRDSLQTIDNSEARYPAASPDGKWLAYSRLDRGVWNLWLRNLVDGTERRITNADCNYIFPAWREDSKTLIYASDCGRALWFTALYSRPIAP